MRDFVTPCDPDGNPIDLTSGAPVPPTPQAALTITGTLDDDKITLPDNCYKVIFQLTGASAYVNPAAATPTTATGIPFAPGIPFCLETGGAAHLFAEAASGTLNALAYCTE